MAVSKRLRFEILKRDESTCQRCGRKAPEVTIQVDHVIPVALGGTDDPSNLQAACFDCNIGKSSVPADAPLVERVSEDAKRWAQAMQQVAEMRAADLDDQFALLDWFMSEWNQWTNWHGDNYDADDAPASIPQFVKAGLTKQEMRELIAVSMKSKATDKWRYFCGCCWRRVKQNQELAAEIVKAAEPAAPAKQPVEGSRFFYTRWTADELDEVLEAAEEMADGINVLRAACRHREEAGDRGYCDDPICTVQYATNLLHSALDWHFFQADQQSRDNRVMDEAEALLDG